MDTELIENFNLRIVSRRKNTTQVGNEFENKVFNVFLQLISDDKLYISKDKSKIFQGKSYFSPARQGKIKTDVSIETFIEKPLLNKSDNYSLLTIIECKNYKRLVPVDDIEEFKAKLDQIGGKNIKGIMVSKSGFAKSTFSYAQSNNIALVRLMEDTEIEWNVYRTVHNSIKTAEIIKENNNIIYNGLLNIKKSHTYYCYCNYQNNYYSSLSGLLSELGVNTRADSVLIDYFVNKIFVKVPFINKKTIEDKSTKLLSVIKTSVSMQTDLTRIIKFIYKKWGIKFLFSKDFGKDKNGDTILARYNLSKKIIEIEKDLDEHRRRFVIAHEIGHIILHRKYLDNSVSESIVFSIDDKNTNPAEVQANIFAANLLMPRNKFLYATLDICAKLEYESRGDYLIYIDSQKCNLANFFSLAGQLSALFNVSIQAVEYRLKDFNLVRDDRRTQCPTNY